MNVKKAFETAAAWDEEHGLSALAKKIGEIEAVVGVAETSPKTFALLLDAVLDDDSPSKGTERGVVWTGLALSVEATLLTVELKMSLEKLEATHGKLPAELLATDLEIIGEDAFETIAGRIRPVNPMTGMFNAEPS